MKTIVCLLVAVAVAAPPFARAAAAQNPLDEARRHYDAAAYEEALSALAGADRSSRSQIVQVEQYRAFCLFALGRRADAETAIAALVDADPLYLPPASPKVQSFVTEVRRSLLPGVARRLLEDGRTAFTQKQHDKARDSFQMLLRVLADPAMQGKPEAADLRVLAEGFVTLLAASPAPAAPAPEPVPALSESAAPATPAAAPVVVPPVAIREVLPPWVPDALAARLEYAGILKIRIGADGRVQAATIQDPSHPSYDVRLLEAARTWQYKPATRNGESVDFDKIIEIRLRRAPDR